MDTKNYILPINLSVPFVNKDGTHYKEYKIKTVS